MYTPITGVWEITMGCNMQCKHCGSSCTSPLPGELTTQEAISLCKEIGELGFKWITLSGGEPTTREDWCEIAAALTENGVVPNMITNGWALTEEDIKRAEKAGINTIAISIDGLEETHDFIRREGSFKRSMQLFEQLKNSSIHSAVITTVHSRNIGELKEMKELFSQKGIAKWQLQIGLPMGNLAKHRELVPEPKIIDQIIDFAYEETQKGGVQIDLADCIGYFNSKEVWVREQGIGQEGYGWDGCGAGRHSMGILHNGDIVGCTSIRSKEFIEGNIKELPLRAIWEREDAFSWNRKISKIQLEGNCKKCKFGSLCKGGCGNTRLSHNGSVYSDNKYCSYSLVMDKALSNFKSVTDSEELMNKSIKFLENKQYQLAEMTLALYLEQNLLDIEAYKHYGLAHFMLENYEQAKDANEKVLCISPKDAYALKGLGLTLARMGETEKGIAYLKQAIHEADENFLDPYYDLAIILAENNCIEEAKGIIESAASKYEKFEPYQKLFDESLLVIQQNFCAG